MHKSRITGVVKSIATLRIRILPNKEQLLALTQLQQDYLNILTDIRDMNSDKVTNSVKLHHVVYYPIRQKYPHLPGGYVLQAERKVAGSYKALSTRARNLKRKMDYLHSIGKSIPGKLYHQYDKIVNTVPNFKGNSIDIHPDSLRSVNVDTLTARLSVGGDILALDIASNKFNIAQLCGNNSTVKGGKLVTDSKGRWFLHLNAEYISRVRGGHIVGIDIGITDLIATSQGEVPVSQEQLDHVKSIRSRRLLHISRLQRNGSKSAKRRLKKTSGRVRRLTEHFMHSVSKQFIGELSKSGTAVLVMENLKRLLDSITKKKQRALIATWAYHKLQQYLAYKAIAKDILVLYVNPAHTSNICAICDKIGTRQGKKFMCECTGHIRDADVNAAINIKNRASRSNIVTTHDSRILRSQILARNAA